jgi:hypothetical protein
VRVRFIKESPEKYRLECVREDGSQTSASLEFRGYFRHDLMHFVVERAAGLQDSFFGLVSRGRNLDELSPQAIKAAAPDLPAEIRTTELVVAALQGASKSGADAAAVCLKVGEYLRIVAPEVPDYLTPDFCRRAVDEHRSPAGRWGQLRGGECLELQYK